MKRLKKWIAISAMVMAAQASQAQDWVGPYAGGFVGINQNKMDWNPGGPTFLGLFASASAGGFAGYNWQNGSAIIGVEILAETNLGSGSFTGVPGPGAANATLKNAASLRARFGAADGNRLTYMFVGLTRAQSEVEAVGFSTQSHTHSGFGLGLGYDVKFRESMFLRTEFEHTKLADGNYEFCGFGCPATISYSRNILRFGIGWEF